MATGMENGKTEPKTIPSAAQQGTPTRNALGAASPPSKRELASWWKKFSRKPEKDEEKVVSAPGIFGVPLAESIRYANVAISLSNDQGESFIYGYVPIVVAKCGIFLKEKATDVEGIFRLSGSAKRIKDLQTIFNSPDRYGKGLDWTGYTVHDAANILRRYLNQLPEPIVPLVSYERFRQPLRPFQSRFEHGAEGTQLPDFTLEEHTGAVEAYKQLIRELPALNRQLLLYILDLLAVFSSKSDLNRMTAGNLAAIFQPGIISHPMHDMAPMEYRLSQDVLIFLIENQDNFLIGMNGTAVDEQTQKHVESGATSTKSVKTTTLGRSASTASVGADSLRKYGVRRNISVSSRNSQNRTSPNVSSPGTPSTPSFATAAGTGSLGRSNTVPSKRSPAINQHRFQRETPSQTSTATATPTAETPAFFEPQSARHVSVASSIPQPAPDAASFVPQDVPGVAAPSTPQTGEPGPTLIAPSPISEPKSHSRERKISNLFSRSPFLGPSQAHVSQGERQPRKLQKPRKLPGSMNASAQSSAASLHNDDGFHTPLVSPTIRTATRSDPIAAAIPNNTTTSGVDHSADQLLDKSPPARDRAGSQLSKPGRSPPTSLHSGTSATDPSDLEPLENPSVREEKRRRWRFSSNAGKGDESPLAPPPPIGQMQGAKTSNSSLGSSRPRHSFSLEPRLPQQPVPDAPGTGPHPVVGQSSYESHEPPKEASVEEKKGLFGKLKAKMQQSREERKEREAERERAKSPQRHTGDNASSRQSLASVAHDHFSTAVKPTEKSREDNLPPVSEQPQAEQSSIQNVVPTLVPATTGPIEASKPPSGQTSAGESMALETAVPATSGTTEAKTAPVQGAPNGDFLPVQEHKTAKATEVAAPNQAGLSDTTTGNGL